MRPLSELGRRENGGRECIRAAVALLGPLVLARARHPLPRPPSSPRVSPARLLATLFLSLCLCVSLATAAVDVFEAIEISTYPSSATKCEEFSIRVPGLNPPRDRPLTVQTIHILLLYPRPSYPSSLPIAAVTSTNFFNPAEPSNARGKRKDDNTSQG